MFTIRECVGDVWKFSQCKDKKKFLHFFYNCFLSLFRKNFVFKPGSEVFTIFYSFFTHQKTERPNKKKWFFSFESFFLPTFHLNSENSTHWSLFFLPIWCAPILVTQLCATHRKRVARSLARSCSLITQCTCALIFPALK